MKWNGLAKFIASKWNSGTQSSHKEIMSNDYQQKRSIVDYVFFVFNI